MMNNCHEDSGGNKGTKTHLHYQKPQHATAFPVEFLQVLKPTGELFAGFSWMAPSRSEDLTDASTLDSNYVLSNCLNNGNSALAGVFLPSQMELPADDNLLDLTRNQMSAFGIPFQDELIENNDHDDLLDIDEMVDEKVDVSGAMLTINNDHRHYNRVEVIFPDDIDSTQNISEEIIIDDCVSPPQGIEMIEVSSENIRNTNQQSAQTNMLLSNLEQDEYTMQHPYPCDFCSRRFCKKSTLMNHIVTHQNDRLIQCKLCRLYFQKKVDLIDHLKNHADDSHYFNHFNISQSPYNKKQIILHKTDDEFINELEDWNSCEIKRKPEPIVRENEGCSLEITNENSYLTYSTTSLHSMSNTSSNCVSFLSLSDSEHQQQPEQSSPLNEDHVLEDLLEDDNLIESESESIYNSFKYNSKESKVSLMKKITNESNLNGDFDCAQCALVFSCQTDLLIHMKTHSNDNLTECTKCGNTLRNKIELIKHKLVCSSQENNVCLRQDSSSDCAEKELVKTLEKKKLNFFCNCCDIGGFQEREQLETHQVNCCKLAKKHSCTTCGIHFNNTLELSSHAGSHIREKTLTCILCGQTFHLETDIRDHIFFKHKDEMTEYSCFICGKNCRSRRKLLKHTWEHSRKNCCICLECGKEFCNVARLKRHMMSHRDKTVHCDVCGKGFPDGRSLSNHRHAHRTDSDAKMFSCDKCGKKFGSRSSQQIHYRIHTGEKPYSCSFCWKAFADGGTLRKHERIHTGEKPYECIVCQKAFNQRVVLREHIRSHHSNVDEKTKTYCCAVCNEKFLSSKDIIEHLIKHCDHNTALKRKPVIGPRKYKRRRKLSDAESNLDKMKVKMNADNNCEENLNDYEDEYEMHEETFKSTQKKLKQNCRKKSTGKKGRPPKKKNNSTVEKSQSKFEEMNVIVHSEEEKSMQISDKNVLKELVQENKKEKVFLNIKNNKLGKELSKFNKEYNTLSAGDIEKKELKNNERNKESNMKEMKIKNKIDDPSNNVASTEKRLPRQLRSRKQEEFLNDKISKTFGNMNGSLTPKKSSNLLENLENLEIGNEISLVEENQVLEILDICDSSLLFKSGACLRNEIDDILNSTIKLTKSNIQYQNNLNLEQHLIKIEPTSPDLNEIMNSVFGANSTIVNPSNGYFALSSATPSEQQRDGIFEKLPKPIGKTIQSDNDESLATNTFTKATAMLNEITLDFPSNCINETITGDRTIIPTWKEEFLNDKINLATSTTSNFHKVPNQTHQNDNNNNVCESNLKEHHYYNTEVKRSSTFFCEMCSLKFTDRAQLLAHVPMHI